jgi:hypothetical protein
MQRTRKRRDVQEYIGGCLVCQKAKPLTGMSHNPLHPLPIPSAPWEAMSWDIIRPLLESRTFNAIITIVNMRMKGIKLKLANITILALGAAMIMRDRVIRRKGYWLRCIVIRAHNLLVSS